MRKMPTYLRNSWWSQLSRVTFTFWRNCWHSKRKSFHFLPSMFYSWSRRKLNSVKWWEAKYVYSNSLLTIRVSLHIYCNQNLLQIFVEQSMPEGSWRKSQTSENINYSSIKQHTLLLSRKEIYQNIFNLSPFLQNLLKFNFWCRKQLKI